MAVKQNISIPSVASDFQIKKLPSNITVTDSDIAALRFNNLVIGERYVVRAQAFTDNPGSGANAKMEIKNGGAALLALGDEAGSADNGFFWGGSSTPFIAIATTMTVQVSITSGGIMRGNGLLDQTWVSLEKATGIAVTTWT